MSRDEATAKAREWGVPYLETSAKTKMNVDESYMNLLRQVLPFFWSEGENGRKERVECKEGEGD